jgi:hypothetical protein
VNTGACLLVLACFVTSLLRVEQIPIHHEQRGTNGWIGTIVVRTLYSNPKGHYLREPPPLHAIVADGKQQSRPPTSRSHHSYLRRRPFTLASSRIRFAHQESA